MRLLFEEWRAQIVQTIPNIDLYRELEVDPAATAETIDAAWKSLLKRHHPDVSAYPEKALERVKRLNLAHDWLSDPAKRATYDRTRRRPVVVMQPASATAPGRKRGRTPTTLSPQPSAASMNAAGAAKADSAAPGAAHGDDASDAPGRPDHNPYAEYSHPGRMSGQRGSDGPSHRGQAARMTTLLIPMALVSVLMVVAISSYLASIKAAPPAANTNVQGATIQPDSTSPTGSSAGGGVAAVPSRGVDPRALPPPNLAGALPKGCDADVSHAFSFEAQVGLLPAQVFVVRCGQSSYGPLVYVPSAVGWELRAKGRMDGAVAYRAFTGGLSGRSPDEFGIAWTRADPATSTVALYRVQDDLQMYWDSSTIALRWIQAQFAYRAAPGVGTPGLLAVISADLSTGTAGCTTCKDHALVERLYKWDTLSGSAGFLRETNSTPASP